MKARKNKYCYTITSNQQQLLDKMAKENEEGYMDAEKFYQTLKKKYEL